MEDLDNYVGCSFMLDLKLKLIGLHKFLLFPSPMHHSIMLNLTTEVSGFGSVSILVCLDGMGDFKKRYISSNGTSDRLLMC